MDEDQLNNLLENLSFDFEKMKEQFKDISLVNENLKEEIFILKKANQELLREIALLKSKINNQKEHQTQKEGFLHTPEEKRGFSTNFGLLMA